MNTQLQKRTEKPDRIANKWLGETVNNSLPKKYSTCLPTKAT